MKLPFPLLPNPVRWLGVVIVAAIIFYGSLVTVPETVVDDAQPGFAPLHYWRHFVAYAALAGALAYATDHWALSRWKHAAVVIALAALYGLAMETGQAFVPHRTDFLITDVAMNTIGASCVLAWFVIRPYLNLTPVSTLLSEINSR